MPDDNPTPPHLNDQLPDGFEDQLLAEKERLDLERAFQVQDPGLTPEEVDALRPSLQHIYQFFGYAHLPHPQREVSEKFASLARALLRTLPANPETTVALLKLLESKDAAVRASFGK